MAKQHRVEEWDGGSYCGECGVHYDDHIPPPGEEPESDGVIVIEGAPAIQNGETVEITSTLGPEGELERSVVTDVYVDPRHSWGKMLTELGKILDHGVDGDEWTGKMPIPEDDVWFDFTARMRFNADGSFDATRVEGNVRLSEPEDPA